MADDDEVHLVVTPGAAMPVVAAYRRASPCETHARCVTGALAVRLKIRDTVPPEVLEDIQSEDWEGDDTPVVDVTQDLLGSLDGRSSDEVQTRPRSPRPSRPDRETGKD